jgi:hypothetical protein
LGRAVTIPAQKYCDQERGDHDIVGLVLEVKPISLPLNTLKTYSTNLTRHKLQQ